MWNSFNAVANKVKSTARVIAAEAYETANELRSIHQDDWSRKADLQRQEEEYDESIAGSLDPFQAAGSASVPYTGGLNATQPQLPMPAVQASTNISPGTDEAAIEGHPRAAAAGGAPVVQPVKAYQPALAEPHPHHRESRSMGNYAPSSGNSDVSARLAALKEKLQAGRKAPVESGSVDLVKPVAMQPAISAPRQPIATPQLAIRPSEQLPPAVAKPAVPPVQQNHPPAPPVQQTQPPAPPVQQAQPQPGAQPIHQPVQHQSMFAAYVPSRPMASAPKATPAAPSSISWLPKPQPFVNAVQQASSIFNPPPVLSPRSDGGPESGKPVSREPVYPRHEPGLVEKVQSLPTQQSVSEQRVTGDLGEIATSFDLQGINRGPPEASNDNPTAANFLGRQPKPSTSVTESAGSGKEAAAPPARENTSSPEDQISPPSIPMRNNDGEDHASASADQTLMLQAALTELERQLQDEQSRRSAAEQGLSAERERVQRAESELSAVRQSALEEQERGQREQQAALERELARRESEAAEKLHGVAASHERELATLREQFEHEMDEIVNERDRHVAALERELTSRARDIDSFERQLEQAHDALEEARGEFDRARNAEGQKMASLEGELAAVHAELEAARREVNLLESTTASERAQHAKQLAELKDQLTAGASSARDQSSLQLGTLQARISTLESESVTARAELQRSRALQESAQAEAERATLRCAELQGELEEADRRASRAEEEAKHAAVTKVAAASSDTSAEVARLQALVADLEKEAAGAATARQQLSKLKQQLLVEQEDEEERLRWRVEAEVKLELERRQAQCNNSDMVPGSEAEMARWRDLALARETELANLTGALDELSYESEAAERLRGEVVALNAALSTARNEGDAARLATLRAEEASRHVQGRVDELTAALAAAHRESTAAAVALAEERKAREAAERRAESLRADAGTAIDRRIVVKMLVAFCERQGSSEVLDLMSSMLGLTDEERGKLAASAQEWGRRRGPSRAGDVVGVKPHQMGPSLASSWIDFLEEAAATEEDPSIGVSSGGLGTSAMNGNDTTTRAPPPYVPLAPAVPRQLFGSDSRLPSLNQTKSNPGPTIWGGPGMPTL